MSKLVVDECPVCMTTRALEMTPCGHKFCPDCLHNSIVVRGDTRSMPCPYCRQDIKPYDSPYVRMASFKECKEFKMKRKVELARNGFYKMSKLERDVMASLEPKFRIFGCQYEDCVRCADCRLIIFCWTKEDKVKEEHMKSKHIPCKFRKE